MKSRQIWSVLGVVMCITLILTACQPQTVVAPTAAVVKEKAPYKVAVLMPGPIADGGWNMLAY